jgi:hypothetical protein
MRARRSEVDAEVAELTMNIRIFGLSCLLSIGIPAFGHHSFAMFELTKDVTYEGTVLEYRWENPHTHIIVKVDPCAPGYGGGMGHRRRGHEHHGQAGLEQSHIQSRRPY